MARVRTWCRSIGVAYWWRRLTLRPCEECGDRWRCWRWHVELFDCPTCGTTIDEFHPNVLRVIKTSHPELFLPKSYAIKDESSTNVKITNCTITGRL